MLGGGRAVYGVVEYPLAVAQPHKAERREVVDDYEPYCSSPNRGGKSSNLGFQVRNTFKYRLYDTFCKPPLFFETLILNAAQCQCARTTVKTLESFIFGDKHANLRW